MCYPCRVTGACSAVCGGISAFGARGHVEWGRGRGRLLLRGGSGVDARPYVMVLVLCILCMLPLQEGCVTSIIHILLYGFIVGIIARAISEAQNHHCVREQQNLLMQWRNIPGSAIKSTVSSFEQRLLGF